MSLKTYWILIVTLLTINVTLAQQKKPNIVWVVSEDNSAEWLKLYNKNGASMPTIEKLASKGLVFNNAFSCAPVCSVARSTIISGAYAPRLGAHNHRAIEKVNMPKDLKLFPYYLRQAGYYTTNCAKEDYNFNKTDKVGVWDASNKKASYRNRKPGQPFFHVQNWFTTHESRLHFNEKTMAKPTKNKKKDIELFPYHPDTDTFRFTYARYLDKHEELDKQIGEFLKNLEEDGLMDDTFIFYYGDHGGVLPRGKGYIYNNGMHVPMVVYVPKNFRHLVPAKPGSRIDGFVEFVDLSATVLNLAGIKVPEASDGTPFLGKGVELKELNKRNVAFGYADRFDEKYDLVRTLRKANFKYTRNYQPFNYDGLYNEYRYKMMAYREWKKLHSEGTLDEFQSKFYEVKPVEGLYDLDNDPHELHNLAGDKKHQKILLELRKELQGRVKSINDIGFIPEPVFLAQGKDNPVEYTAKNKEKIHKLIDIADLQLVSFSKAKTKISEALKSEEPIERYWGLILCSTFSKEASSFYSTAKELAKNDVNLLVRTRAAEFLALTDQEDPRPVLMDVLRTIQNPIEANLILNTVALLHDSKPNWKFNLSEFQEAAWKGKLTKPRLSYIK